MTDNKKPLDILEARSKIHKAYNNRWEINLYEPDGEAFGSEFINQIDNYPFRDRIKLDCETDDKYIFFKKLNELHKNQTPLKIELIIRDDDGSTIFTDMKKEYVISNIYTCFHNFISAPINMQVTLEFLDKY